MAGMEENENIRKELTRKNYNYIKLNFN